MLRFRCVAQPFTRRPLHLLSLLIIPMLSASPAMAVDRPELCRSGFNLQSFDQGFNQGRNLINRLFQQVGSDDLQRCQRNDRFANDVTTNIQRLTLPENPTDFVICRHSGLAHGTYDALLEINSKCDFECAFNGELIGELSAKFYCDFAITFDGYPADPNWIPRNAYTTCDFSFTTSCDVKFNVEADQFVQPVTSLLCKPYIDFSEGSSYLQTRGLSCELPPPFRFEPDFLL